MVTGSHNSSAVSTIGPYAEGRKYDSQLRHYSPQPTPIGEGDLHDVTELGSGLFLCEVDGVGMMRAFLTLQPGRG